MARYTSRISAGEYEKAVGLLLTVKYSRRSSQVPATVSRSKAERAENGMNVPDALPFVG